MVTSLIFYCLSALELKRHSLEASVKRYFPLALLAMALAQVPLKHCRHTSVSILNVIFFSQFAMTIPAVSVVEGGDRGCRLVDGTGFSTERLMG